MKLGRSCGKLIPTFYLKIVDKDQLSKIKNPRLLSIEDFLLDKIFTLK